MSKPNLFDNILALIFLQKKIFYYFRNVTWAVAPLLISQLALKRKLNISEACLLGICFMAAVQLCAPCCHSLVRNRGRNLVLSAGLWNEQFYELDLV